MKKLKKVLLALLAVLLLLCGAFGVYCSVYYHADVSVQSAIESSAETGITVTELPGKMIVFEPEKPVAGLIFYPGGKVEYTAYAPLMQQLAKEGILCVLIHMPGNLAILDSNAADGIPSLFPEIEDWYIGGHSLGGCFSAIYAEKHPEDFSGIIFFAAYSSADLRNSGLKVLSIFGSEDGVIRRDRCEKYSANLPAGNYEFRIDGGCHSYFGNYGLQKGDGSPTISREEQIKLTAQAVSSFVKNN